MKKLACALLLLGGVAFADGKPTTMAAADMKWDPVPNTKVVIATLSGDFAKGPHAVLSKFPPNDMHPLHTHSANIKIVVVSGSFMFGGEGEKAKAYGPGSYVTVPANFKHTSGSGAEGCTLYQEGDAGFDMKMVETAAKKPAAKK